MKNVSCIIPVYNEGERVRHVLAAVIGHPLIAEIIVVNDASTDSTAQILSQYPEIIVVTHDVNAGKTKSVYDGMLISLFPYILLLDADLVGITAQNVTNLIEPAITDQCDVSISLRKNAPWTDRMLGIDYISGERVFRKTLLTDQLEKLVSLPRFGLEVFFNNIILKHQYRIAVVPWINVISPYPTEKFGFREGVHRFIGMIKDMVNTVSLKTVVSQYIGMYRLKRKYEKSQN